jgi:hypothetical protein
MPQGPPADHPQATTVLVLGIVGLVGGVFFGLPFVVSPVAWVMGRRALREIDASGGALGGRSNAQAGYVLGIIGTVLLALAVVALILILVVGLLIFTTSSTTTVGTATFG